MTTPHNTLKQGDLVMVFSDPVTCKELEGNAGLKKRQRANGDGSEYWQVTFEEDGFTCLRTVWPKHVI